MPTPFGLYHITLVGRLHGQVTQNGFYFRTRGEDSPETYAQELIDLINDFNDHITNLVCVFADQEWECNGIVGTTLFPAGGPMFELGPLGLNGAQTDGSLPPYCSGVVAYRTGINTAHSRGRNYFAGVSKGQSESGRIVGANLTQLQSIGDGLLSRYGSGVSTTRPVWGVFSNALGRTRIVGPPVHMTYDADAGFFPVIQATARPTVFTQGHRRLNRGI